jgi:hypothetical protein
MVTEILLAAAITAVFVVPALLRPTLGRGILSLLFLGGGLFNLLYTFPNAPRSLVDLVATAPIPPYREVVAMAVARQAAPALALATVACEFTAGGLILWRGPSARLALLGAGAWGFGMLPVIPPEGMLVGVALTGAPGLAALLLARRTYADSVLTVAWRYLHGPRPDPQAA